MIILLKSVKTDSRRLFRQISYYKVQQNNFIIKCDKLLSRSVSDITKCVRYYKVLQTLLQSVSGITKCNSCFRLRHNNWSIHPDMLWKIYKCPWKYLWIRTRSSFLGIFLKILSKFSATYCCCLFEFSELYSTTTPNEGFSGNGQIIKF